MRRSRVKGKSKEALLYEGTYFWKACCVAADPLVKHRAFCLLRPHGHISVMCVLQGVSGHGCP